MGLQNTKQNKKKRQQNTRGSGSVPVSYEEESVAFLCIGLGGYTDISYQQPLLVGAELRHHLYPSLPCLCLCLSLPLLDGKQAGVLGWARLPLQIPTLGFY
jgi:hypothetical protein